jgi:acyl-CoA thioesterase-1
MKPLIAAALILFLTWGGPMSLKAAGPAAVPAQVLIIGDSLTAGLGVMPEQAYPDLVQEMLNKADKGRVKVINAGISGSTSAGSYSRLKWYLKARPSVLVLALGANDGLRGLPVEDMEKNLDKAIVLAKEAGIKVILCGMEVPPNYGPGYTARFRKVFPDLAGKHGVPLIPFLLEGVAGQADLNQADGIHPNAAGHKIIAHTVFPYILECL